MVNDTPRMTITRQEAAILLAMLPIWLDVSRVTVDDKSNLRLTPREADVLTGLLDGLDNFFADPEEE